MAQGSRFCSSHDYDRYLDRYEWEGEGLPRLSEAEFCALDEEMMDLEADRAAGGKLTPAQRKRLRELRKLLLTNVEL
jgi:hypothetical protein